MKSIKFIFVLCFIFSCFTAYSQQIPLPEHLRPDFERTEWINLNGLWNFSFDEQTGNKAVAQNNMNGFDLKINVPFGWGSKLSGVENKAGSYGYLHEVTIPKEALQENQQIIIRMEVPEGIDGGLPLYGKRLRPLPFRSDLDIKITVHRLAGLTR